MKQPTEHAPFSFRIADASRLLGIGRTSLYELAKSGKIKIIKIAGRSVVPRSELERLTRLPPEGVA